MSDPVNLLPDDDYNRELVGNVHPPDWINPEPQGRYNLVVIGAGTAGLVTAVGAAGLGAKVALIERHLFGGDCLNYGCVPSKAVIRSSRVIAEITGASQYGIDITGNVSADFPAVMERMRKLRAKISEHDSVQRFSEMGIDIFLGDAEFARKGIVSVAGKNLQYKRAVIASGARAYVPEIPGLADAEFLTNETVFSLTEQPGSLAVIGAGPIGCELAQAMRRFGVEVHLFNKHPHLLPREDEDAAEIIQNRFVKEGINLIQNSEVTSVEKKNGRKIIRYTENGTSGSVEVDEILIGAGRVPNVDGLGLENVGVEYNKRSGITVNDRLQTTNKMIYAAGDCCMKYKFTHAADFAARMVIQNALFKGRKKLSALTIPWSTYTDPEIAHVGLYPSQAEKTGIPIDTYKRDFKEVDRAIVDGETEGFVKIHTKKGKGEIVGATIVAPHAGDMISEITVAMTAGMSLGSLANVIHPYPTQAEGIRQAGDAYNRTRLTPFVKKLFKKWLTWTK